MKSYTNLLDVDCAACGAHPGKSCTKSPSGIEAPYVHVERITLSRWTAKDPERFARAYDKASGRFVYVR